MPKIVASLNEAIMGVDATGPEGIIFTFVSDIAGGGDVAGSEVLGSLSVACKSRLGQYPRIPFTWDPVLIPRGDTVAAGFCVGLLALTPAWRRPTNRVILVNVAHRKGIKPGETKGEVFNIAVLRNGAIVGGPNAGHSFSFVRDQISLLYSCEVPEECRSFRSCEFYPFEMIHILRGTFAGLKPLPREEWNIPDVPECAVARADNFGNVKTTIHSESPLLARFPLGGELDVKANRGDPWGGGRSVHCSYPFAAGEGNLAFAPGSSKFQLLDENGGCVEISYYELFLVGGDANYRLRGVKGGDPLTLTPVQSPAPVTAPEHAPAS